MLATDPAAYAQLFIARLDELEPLEALRVLGDLRERVDVALDDQLARARLLGCSWRSMSLASGVGMSTTRRWAAVGRPDQTRRR